MNSRVIADLVLRLGYIASGDGLTERLTPAQWSALSYFARANRFSRTPSAFAEFRGTTRGTASQTIKSLIAQGYLKQTRSEADRRSIRLDLTDNAGSSSTNPSRPWSGPRTPFPPASAATSRTSYSACSARWRGSEANLPSVPARRVSIWKATAAAGRDRRTIGVDS